MLGDTPPLPQPCGIAHCALMHRRHVRFEERTHNHALRDLRTLRFQAAAATGVGPILLILQCQRGPPSAQHLAHRTTLSVGGSVIGELLPGVTSRGFRIDTLWAGDDGRDAGLRTRASRRAVRVARIGACGDWPNEALCRSLPQCYSPAKRAFYLRALGVRHRRASRPRATLWPILGDE